MEINCYLDDTILIAVRGFSKRDGWTIKNKKALILAFIEEKGIMRRVHRRLTGISMGSFCRIIESDSMIRKVANKHKIIHKNPSRYIGKDGYIYVNGKKEHLSLVKREHSKQVIHHINLDKTDNRLSNLHICENNSKHMQLHYQLEKLAGNLVKLGIIEFIPELEEYVYVHTYKDPLLGEYKLEIQK